jgi:hypothetical protein
MALQSSSRNPSTIKRHRATCKDCVNKLDPAKKSRAPGLPKWTKMLKKVSVKRIRREAQCRDYEPLTHPSRRTWTPPPLKRSLRSRHPISDKQQPHIEPCSRPSVRLPDCRCTNLLIPASERCRSGGAMCWEWLQRFIRSRHGPQSVFRVWRV